MSWPIHEETHWGEHPMYGYLTQHKGLARDCTAPGCMDSPEAVEARMLADIERLRAALQAIVDYEPELDYTPVDNKDCAACAEWRAKNHPIQSMCEEHVRAFYQREARNDRTEATQHWRLRDIARSALEVRP